MKRITILGATGSIGLSTLDVVQRHPSKFSVFALAANRNVDEMYRQCLRVEPVYAVMAHPESAHELAHKLKTIGSSTEVLAGEKAMADVASDTQVDYVMAAIVGAAGLKPTLAAVRAGKRVLLANKEALVMSGDLFMSAARESGATVLPIDSEHNAIFQCLPSDYQSGQPLSGVRRILLTASGGPFRNMALDELHHVTPAQACKHPNWSMGKKISVDSASLMNKGLELIEACWLFDTSPDKVDVHIHPQSIIHSMVEYIDGSVLAQMGSPDMRTPIAYGLGWPERTASGTPFLDLFTHSRLDFEKPDHDRFPCLNLAAEAFSTGGTAPAILNASNEIAVDAFLTGAIRFTDIPRLIESVLSDIPSHAAKDFDQIFADDARARQHALTLVERFRSPVNSIS